MPSAPVFRLGPSYLRVWSGQKAVKGGVSGCIETADYLETHLVDGKNTAHIFQLTIKSATNALHVLLDEHLSDAHYA